MVKNHFITFATPEHMSFAEANVKSALEVGGFDTAKIYIMDDIDDYFKAKNAHIFALVRGSGYWIWKPYIILKKLLEIEEGDILCYNDSKYLWLKNIRQFEADLLSNKNIGVYKNKPNDQTYIEKEWTKFDSIALMNIKHENNFRNNVINTNQVWAGFILLRKTFNSIRFVGEWLTYVQDYRIVTDSPSIFGPENTSFREHRHDQSILSLLCKKWGIYFHEMNKNYMIDVRNPM
jgi:hypothetical protein